MIAAAGPRRIPLRVTWPLHTSLRELYEEAARRGLLEQLRVEFVFDLAPECGLRTRGADEALEELVDGGLLRPVGELGDAALEVDVEVLVAYRRALMLQEPEVARLFQRAGSRWSALTSTCSKNAATPARSSGSTVARLTA